MRGFTVGLGGSIILAAFCYGLVNGLDPQTKAMIAGGVLVVVGVMVMGVFAFGFMALFAHREPNRQQAQQNPAMLTNTPFIVLGGPQPQQGLSEAYNPPPQYSQRQIEVTKPVQHEDW